MSRLGYDPERLALFLLLAENPVNDDNQATLSDLFAGLTAVQMSVISSAKQLVNFQRAVFQLACMGDAIAARYVMSSIKQFKYPAYCMGTQYSRDNLFVREFCDAQAEMLQSIPRPITNSHLVIDRPFDRAGAAVSVEDVHGTSLDELVHRLYHDESFDVRQLIFSALIQQKQQTVLKLLSAMLKASAVQGMNLATECIDYCIAREHYDFLVELIGRLPESNYPQCLLVYKSFLLHPDNSQIMMAYYFVFIKLGFHVVGQAELFEMGAILNRLNNDFSMLECIKHTSYASVPGFFAKVLTQLSRVGSSAKLKANIVEHLLSIANAYLSNGEYMIVMATVYDNGLGVPIDAQKARLYWQTAADLGSEQAFNHLYKDLLDPDALLELAKNDCRAAYDKLVTIAQGEIRVDAAVKAKASTFVTMCIDNGYGVDCPFDDEGERNCAKPDNINTVRRHDGSQLQWLSFMVRINLLLMGGTGLRVQIKQFDMYAGMFRGSETYHLFNEYFKEYVDSLAKSSKATQAWLSCANDIEWAYTFMRDDTVTALALIDRLDAGHIVPLSVEVTDFQYCHMVNMTFFKSCGDHYLVLNDKAPGFLGGLPGMNIFRIHDISVLVAATDFKHMIQRCANHHYQRCRSSFLRQTMHQHMNTEWVMAIPRKGQVGDECVPQAEMVKVLTYMLAKGCQTVQKPLTAEIITAVYPHAKQAHRGFRGFVRSRAENQLLQIVEHYKSLGLPIEQVVALLSTMSDIVQTKLKTAKYVVKHKILEGMAGRLVAVPLVSVGSGESVSKHPRLAIEDEGKDASEEGLKALCVKSSAFN